MLITTTRSATNNVHKAVVETEANSLEVNYFKTYGEPTVTTGGDLTYPETERTPQSTTLDTVVLGVEEDALNGRTIVFIDPAQVDLTEVEVGDSWTLVGITNEPLLNGTFEVLAVDQIHNSVALDVSGISTDNPFQAPAPRGTITIDGGTADVNAVLGVVEDGVSPTVLNVVDAVDLSGPTTIVIAGVEGVIDGSYAVGVADGEVTVDNTTGAKTITLNGTPAGTPTGATDDNPFTAAFPQGDVSHTVSDNAFLVTGGVAYVRSSSPFQFTVDGNSDADAEAKVTAWAEDLVAKISGEMLTLKALPNPSSKYPIVETTEV